MQSAMAATDAPTCPICYDTMLEVETTPCGHAFCKVCYDRWYNENATCPMCRQTNQTTTVNTTATQRTAGTDVTSTQAKAPCFGQLAFSLQPGSD
jgi:hypothetical protein